jgi:glycosyltransferase involved in cell wall biosynthesis
VAWLRDRWLERLRNWDRRTAAGVTHFIAISRTVQQRILDCYGRSSEVIYPPVDTDFFQPADVAREDYYLALSALVPYKRLDLAVLACDRLRRRLVVIGSGPEEKRLRALAGPTIALLGWQSGTVVRHHLQRCRALLFPGVEDFGIVPVEAQACGTPVIALGAGGVTETVLTPEICDEPTGLFFQDQNVESLIEGVERFERIAADFRPEAARRQACRFAHDRFERQIMDYIAACGFGAGRRQPRSETHHGQHGVHTGTRTVT